MLTDKFQAGFEDTFVKFVLGEEDEQENNEQKEETEDMDQQMTEMEQENKKKGLEWVKMNQNMF